MGVAANVFGGKSEKFKGEGIRATPLRGGGEPNSEKITDMASVGLTKKAPKRGTGPPNFVGESLSSVRK